MRDYRTRRGRGKRIFLFIVRVLLLIILVNIIQQNMLVGVRIRGSAMSPTLNDRDVAYGSHLIYASAQRKRRLWFRQHALPSYGDVVYIRFPYDTEHSRTMGALDKIVRFFTLQRVIIFSEPRLVRRIIALPGDTVRMRDFRFFVAPRETGVFQSELAHSSHAYQTTVGNLPADWKSYYPFSSDFTDYIVPPMSYFVAADNRIGTLDSRVWGAIPHDAIVAPMFLVRRFPLRIRSIRRASELR